MTTWHLHRNGKQLAPVSSQQLKQLAAIGELSPVDLVWKDGMPEWVAAGKIKGLFPVADDYSPQQPQTASAPAGDTVATNPVESDRETGYQRQFPVVALVGAVALIILVGVICIVFWPDEDSAVVDRYPSQESVDDAQSFSDVDYSSDFGDIDYSVPTVDLSKGPNGEQVETRTFEVSLNSGLEGLVPADEGYFDSNGKFVRTKPPSNSNEPEVKNKVASEGYIDADGEFVRHGKTAVFSQDGRLQISEAEYFQGELHGIEKQWDANSTYVVRTTSYSHGQKHGPSLEYYSSGQKKIETPWLNGRRHGVRRMWQPTGQLYQGVAFVDGHEHGPQTEWFDTGQKYQEIHFDHGLRHGPVREWYRNGQLRTECQFVKGQMHGEMRDFDEQGTLLTVSQFDHGTLLSERNPQIGPKETRGFTKQAFAVIENDFSGRLEDHSPGSRADFMQALKVCGAQIIDNFPSNGIATFVVSDMPYEENGEHFQPSTFRRTSQEWTRVFGDFERLPDQYNTFVGAYYQVWRFQCTDGPLTFSGSIYDLRGETFLSAGGMYFADHVPQD